MNPPTKPGLHPRNRFRERYDYPALIAASPPLAPHVKTNAHGDDGVDFADPHAVKALNQALLRHAYGIHPWDIPPGSLCPAVPGRSDYIHHLADLIGGRRGAKVRVLDIGTGASCIYPLIGASEYGWSFVASELSPSSWRWARRLVAAIPHLSTLIECRHQPTATQCFGGILRAGERFALTLCNPPFHTSATEAASGTQRKQRALGTPKEAGLNFGGHAQELWCPGGELSFIRRMIRESQAHASACEWFTSLVSKSAHLPPLQKALRAAHASEIRIIPMAQGQKQSRILAWTFQHPAQSP